MSAHTCPICCNDPPSWDFIQPAPIGRHFAKNCPHKLKGGFAALAKQADDSNPKDALGARKPDLSLIPPAAMIYTAQALEEGAAKYGPYNWRTKKVRARVYVAAALRHICEYLDGTDTSPDYPKPSLGGALASLAILVDAIETGNVIDDRPAKGAASRMLAVREASVRRDFLDSAVREAVERERHRKGEESVAQCAERRLREMRGQPVAERPATFSAEHDGVARELDRRPGAEPAPLWQCLRCGEQTADMRKHLSVAHGIHTFPRRHQ